MKGRNVLNTRGGLIQVSQMALVISLASAASLVIAGVAQAQDAGTSNAGTQTTTTTAAPKAPPAEAADDKVEVIVTGVMAKTKAKQANVSYSILDQNDIDRFTPISASDMLRDMPGTVVETNDGVARNEVFTRGMVIGTGANTTGYFWSTILEDGLPETPAKFSGFQDGDFYRADIATEKVESVRGGSSATGVTTSIGATFNYLDNLPIQTGGAIQTRIGFEGTDDHLSWKQVDGEYGWMNKTGDLGYKISGFYRSSNGAVNPGFDINHGGQFKASLYKSYDTSNGSGSFRVTWKHLDDDNGVNTSVYTPAIGYNNPQPAPGWGAEPDLLLSGGTHQVPLFNAPGSQTDDPTQGFHYKQDAVWVNWEHHTNGHWNFSAAAKAQYSQTIGQEYLDNGVLPINSTSAAQTLLGTSVDGISKLGGYYEYFDSQSGALVAKVANQPSSGAKIGTDYQTGAACTTNCVVFDTLPNQNFNLNGGLVTATVPNSAGVYASGVIPASGAGNDLVDMTKSEFTYRSSRDLMANLTANWVGDHFKWNFGIYANRSIESYKSWGSGYGISAWAPGQIRNLNVKFVTTAGTTYQLTDSGGWGQLGSGAFGTFFAYNTQTEIAPYFAVAWAPDSHWDLNFSAKYDFTHAKTSYDNWNVRNPSAASLAYGGLDGNPLTVYDNLYFVDNPALITVANKSVGVWNWSGSVGYNFNSWLKMYYRYTSAAQPAFGVMTRYTTPSSLVKSLGPNALMNTHELALIFGKGKISGQITYYYQDYGLDNFTTAYAADNVTIYQEPIREDIYFSRGIESWVKWNVFHNFSWQGDVTWGNGKAVHVNNWLNTSANGLGPSDDVDQIISGPIARNPDWILSNTLIYEYHDWAFNLRHRWMSERKETNNPLDDRYLPAENNVDASIQYVGLKDTRISLDIRNLTNTSYISAYDTLIGGTWPTNVQKWDVYNQLPNSAIWTKHNDPRSFWLTMKHEF